MNFLQRPVFLSLLQKHSKYAAIAALVLLGLLLKSEVVSEAQSSDALTGDNSTSTQATVAARSMQRQDQLRQIRPENYDLNRFPVVNKMERYWRNMLWTTAVIEPVEPFVADALDQILGMMVQPKLTNAQMRTVDAATKVATQLYLRHRSFYNQIEQRFLQAIEQSPDPEWVAQSLSALAQGGLPADQLQSLTERVKARFPNWSRNVYLYTTVREVGERLAPRPTPPLGDLLNWEIAPRQVHLYVICQRDRDVLCRTVLKNREGQFIRQTDRTLWSVPLLLRSIHGLAWNFVRGQTPQGIYRMEGTVPQPDEEFFRAYGKFSLVNLYVPFEAGAKQFLPGKAGTFKGNLADYQALLPPSWRDQWAIQQTYWAGKIGRSAFRIHGTGEAPDFFSNKGSNPSTYNWNPTIGCLSALELYDEQGQLLNADMPKLLNALEMVGGRNFAGYLVVVEVAGKPGQSIALEQIDAAIQTNRRASQPKSPATRVASQPITLTRMTDATGADVQDLRNVSFTSLDLSELSKAKPVETSAQVNPVLSTAQPASHVTPKTTAKSSEQERSPLNTPPFAY